MRLYGYARTADDSQSVMPQVLALERAGCTDIVVENANLLRGRPTALGDLISKLTDGDALAVTRLNRVAMSVADQLRLIEEILTKRADFISLRELIDTRTTAGKRKINKIKNDIDKSSSLILPERPNEKSIAKGQIKREQKIKISPLASDQIRKLKRDRHEKYIRNLTEFEHEWLPYVTKLRPKVSFNEVVRTINENDPKSGSWTVWRLQQAIRAYVGVGKIPSSFIGRSRRLNVDRRLPDIVLELLNRNPQISLSELGRTLEAMGEPSPQGLKTWRPSSVRTLVERAKRLSSYESD